jgi:hypothetical protein
MKDWDSNDSQRVGEKELSSALSTHSLTRWTNGRRVLYSMGCPRYSVSFASAPRKHTWSTGYPHAARNQEQSQNVLGVTSQRFRCYSYGPEQPPFWSHRLTPTFGDSSVNDSNLLESIINRSPSISKCLESIWRTARHRVWWRYDDYLKPAC